MDTAARKQRIEEENRQIQDAIIRLNQRLLQLQGQYQLLLEIEEEVSQASISPTLTPDVPSGSDPLPLPVE